MNHYKKPRHQPPPTWDAFVRGGTRLKTLLTDAYEQTKEAVEIRDEPMMVERPDEASLGAAAALARDKTTQALMLERVRGTCVWLGCSMPHSLTSLSLSRQQLAQAKSHASALEASNTSLREEAAASQARLDRTVAALRIAGQNAAKARSDADAAEASAASLASTLQSLQTVVEETKRASHVLHEEQEQVAEAARKVQVVLLQKQSELAAAQHALQTLRRSSTHLELDSRALKQDKALLQTKVTAVEQEVDQLRRTLEENAALEAARKQRAAMIEEEWRQAQALLASATAGQQQAQQTQAMLEASVKELQASNAKLHAQMTAEQEASRAEKARLHEALTAAEKQVQQLRIRVEADEETIQRQTHGKALDDKQIAQLKSQVSTLERRLKDASLASPPAAVNTEDDSHVATAAIPFRLPPLQGTLTKEPTTSSAVTPLPPTSRCCLCLKASFGLMKSCQCGHADCDKRAHIHCAQRIQPAVSVSHPGTPAPRLPMVLCSNGGKKKAA